MYSKAIPGVLILAGILSVLSPTIGRAQSIYEAKMYAVTTWDGGCSGAARDWWDNMADAWYNEITRVGVKIFGLCLGGHCEDAYRRDGRQVNGSIVNSQFADASVVTWGNDSAHLDEGDAVLVAWHGSETSNIYLGSMRVDQRGSGDCDLRRDEMLLGNSDLEFLHLSSCQSMDDNQWSSWWQAFRGVHQVDGFHGWMWIGSGLVSDYSDFAADGFSTTIANAWLDNMYRPNISGNDDQCPVAYAVGRNSDDTWRRIGSERYNNVLSDPRAIGYWGVVFISGCDPFNEDVINSNTNS
jgi:hypothetical protein